MPTATRSKTQKSRTRTELERHAPEPEAVGLGIAPGLPGDDRSELVERAEIGAGQPRRGAPAGDRPDWQPLASELIDEAVDRAAGRRRLDGGGDRRARRAVGAADQAAGRAGDGGRADRPRRLRAASGAARRRRQPAQRLKSEDADLRAREGPDRRAARP